MSHIPLSCNFCVKIDFSFDSGSKYYKDQEKKKDSIFYRSRKGLKCLKWLNPRWPPKYIKIKIFTNNFATTYARHINNMSILMFSGIRKPILSFDFRNKYCKVYIHANMNNVLIMLGWFPYGDIWADVGLSSLWMFCKTWNSKWLPSNHRSYILSNKP